VEREDAVPVGARRKHHGAVRAPEARVARRPPVGSEHERLRPTHRARARAHDPTEEERAFLVVVVVARVAVRSRKPHVRRVPLRSVIFIFVVAQSEVDDGAVVASLVIVAIVTIVTTGIMVVHFRKREKKRGVFVVSPSRRQNIYFSFFSAKKKCFLFFFSFVLLFSFLFSFCVLLFSFLFLSVLLSFCFLFLLCSFVFFWGFFFLCLYLRAHRPSCRAGRS
jgi:hypothetical protein